MARPSVTSSERHSPDEHSGSAPSGLRRLLGIDRSGGPPPETQKGEPLRPWTVPNAISYVRLALLPVFLIVALNSGDGRDAAAAALYFGIAWGDQLDGLAARLTGQYSRLGALLDPLTDRALVIAGVIVCWHFELLPRWALAVLAARELVMLILTQVGLRAGMDLRINMVGRWAVWPVMFAIFLAMIVDTWVAAASLYLGLALTLWATAIYLADGVRFMQARRRPSSST
ncbi:MAG TPA: CDP-alcohol phosphatidyltransferase family protein [Thermoleophilaceae bacterium]|nr:CDP-alcohol phosphatidyltransferase family protein [Thermoleophilaceae bacterium]